MVKRLLDRGTYDILEFKLDVDYRGRSIIRMVGVGKSQEKDVEFEIKVQSSVIKGWPVITDAPEKLDVPTKRGPGRPRIAEDE